MGKFADLSDREAPAGIDCLLLRRRTSSSNEYRFAVLQPDPSAPLSQPKADILLANHLGMSSGGGGRGNGAHCGAGCDGWV